MQVALSAPDSSLGLLPLHRGAQRQRGLQPQQPLRMPCSHLQAWRVYALLLLEQAQHVQEALTGCRCQGARGRHAVSHRQPAEPGFPRPHRYKAGVYGAAGGAGTVLGPGVSHEQGKQGACLHGALVLVEEETGK